MSGVFNNLKNFPLINDVFGLYLKIGHSRKNQEMTNNAFSTEIDFFLSSGPEEDLPRKLDCMEYVCHAPTEYFRAKTAPYPTTTAGPELGYVWTSLGYEIVRSPSYDEIFGLAKPVPEPKERQPREKREPKDKSEPKEKKEGKEKKDSIKDKTQLKEKEIKKEPKVAEKRVNKR